MEKASVGFLVLAARAVALAPKAPTLLPLDDYFQSSIFDRLRQDLVVAFALIGVGDGEVRHGPVEFVARAEVSADLCRLAAAGVRTGEGPST
jgi:hypothetical protein